MATYTKYKNLEKPLSTEKYDIGVANKNNDVIDSELHKLDLKNESQEKLLATKEELKSEISRATNKENEIVGKLNEEISRAQSAENELSSNIDSEFSRAIAAEAAISNNLSILIEELTTRINTLADSDDTTLDQLSEIVAYIKNNKSLIDGITTSKVNVSDVIDNLASTATNKPLSANQGKNLDDKKVDKISGKGLSTNDYTTAEKNKLSGIAAGAEVNVQSDWNITDPASDAYIKNKPTSMPSSDNFILLNQQSLAFTNNICTISDSRITANSLADVYFTTETIDIAENADISVETYGGKVQLTAKNIPTGAIKASIMIRVV